MENQNDKLLLLFVFLLSQNKELMKNLTPALDFIEGHKQSLSLLQSLFSDVSVPEGGSPFKQEPPVSPFKQQTPTDPFSGVANEETLKKIQAYFSSLP